MGTLTGTTSTDIALALRTAYTTPLLTKVASGSKIYASDILMLQAFANVVVNHTHDITEYSDYGDFGNLGNNVAVNTTTSLASGAANVVFADAVSLGGKIRATQYNALNVQANNFISHTHTFADTYT